MRSVRRKGIKLGLALLLSLVLAGIALPGTALAYRGGPRRHPHPTYCHPRSHGGYATFNGYTRPKRIVRKSQEDSSNPAWYYQRVNGKYKRVHLSPRYGTADKVYKRSYRNTLRPVGP